MSRHSYSRLWLHLIWGTKKRRPLLPKPVAVKVAAFLKRHAADHGIYLRSVYVNPDHVHVLLDLPPRRSAAEVAQLLKGASARYINYYRLIPVPFAWARGYGVFSISHWDHQRIVRYIANQEEHHRGQTFGKEYQEFLHRCGLQSYEDTGGED